MASQSSSDYFGEEDSQFLEALQNMVLPGDKPPHTQTQPSNEPILIEDNTEDEESPPPPAQPGLKRRHSKIEPEPEEVVQPALGEDIYGASHFGQFGEYMRRKRAKLQIQNQTLEADIHTNEAMGGGIFEGVAIYVSHLCCSLNHYPLTTSPHSQVNGWTKPSVQELRKLIVENGGIYQPYLDKKSIV